MATAATRPGEPVAATSPFKRLARERRLLIAVAVFLVLLATVASIGSARLTYYDLSQLAASGAPLALAAIGQTIVILSGGFDLSAGAAISLVNVALASSLQDPSLSPLVVIAAGVGIGMAAGAFNGFFVAVLRMQPIVVTLATMFILQGVTLLIMDKPGGQVSPALADLLLGDAVPNILPRPVLLIVLVLAAWVWLKRTNFGVAIYAVGGDVDSARAVGVPTRFVQFMVFVVGGVRHGLGRRLHQRGDWVGRSADRQPHAAPDVRGRRRRRDEARRRAGGPLGYGIWRLHPDDGSQHPPGPQRVGVLLDDRRGLDPHSCRARRRSAAGLSARPPHPPCRPQGEGARAGPPCLPTLARDPIPEPAALEKRAQKTRTAMPGVPNAKRGGAALRASFRRLLRPRGHNDAIGPSATQF